MTKKTKGIIIGISIFGITTSVLTPTIIATVNKNKINIYNDKNTTNDSKKIYNFNNKSFNTQEELVDYAIEQSSKEIAKEKENINWSLEINNKIQNFNDPKVLLNFIESKIEEYDTASSTSISVNHNGIPTSELRKLYDSKNIKTQRIYRGKDNQYFTSEKAAKESYLEIHDAYYFDGIYFRNKEELSNFIRQNIDKYKNLIDQGQSFVIQNSKNYKSKPINFSDRNTDETRKYVEDFVNLNKFEYLEIKNIDNTLSYIDANDLDKDPLNVTSKINNYSYVKMQSNQGKGSYLVDLDIEDNFQLFGPYYVQSSSIINQMKDKSQWKKTTGTDHQIVNNILENKKISNFFGTLMTDLTDINTANVVDMPFKFAGIEKECDDYFNMLKMNYYSVYSDVMNLYRTMKKGKNYNLFMKIPILFIKTINSIMEFGLEQSIIDKTREFYTFIMNEFDSRIYEVIPNYFLQNRAGKTLSLTNIFNFHSPTFDLNTDVETFIDNIIYSYPRMKEIIDFIFNIKDLQLTTLNLISPDLDYYDMLFSTKISMKPSIEKEWYLKMWEALWTTDANQLLKVSNEIRNTNNRSTDFVNKIFVQNIEYLDTTQTNYLKFIESEINSNYDYWNTRFEILNIINNKEIDRELKFQKVILLINTPLWKTEIINAKNSYDIQLLVRKIFKTKNSLNSLFSNNAIFNSCSITRIASYEYKYIPGQLKSETWRQDIALVVTKTINDILNIGDSLINILDAVKKIANLAGQVLKILTAVNAAFMIASVLLDIAVNMFQVEHFSYKFETKDVKYIWNGGKTNKWFYGLIEVPVTTIDSMKLLGPLEVVSSHTNNNYYYSGKYYDDLEVLKKQQLWDIAKKRYNPPFIQTIYSFEKINPYMLSRPKYAFEKIGRISDDDDENLAKYVFENIKNKGHYTSENVYKYGNGIVYDKNISLDQNINQVISNILAVKIAILPNLENNYPVYRDDDKVDNSLDKYELPETSWTPLNGYIKNKSKKKYVIYDPNIDPNKNSEVQTNELIIKKMQEKFYSQFDVISKDIILDDLHTKKLFSEYNNNILYNNIYYAKNEKHEFKIFNSKDHAINWLLQQYKFKTYHKEITTSIYNFNGKRFYSLDEYIKWVLSQTNIVEKEGK